MRNAVFLLLILMGNAGGGLVAQAEDILIDPSQLDQLPQGNLVDLHGLQAAPAPTSRTTVDPNASQNRLFQLTSACLAGRNVLTDPTIPPPATTGAVSVGGTGVPAPALGSAIGSTAAFTGKQLFEARCSGCHQGQGTLPDNRLRGAERVLKDMPPAPPKGPGLLPGDEQLKISNFLKGLGQ